MKKLLLLPIFAIACLFVRIDSAWAIDYPFSLTTSATNSFEFDLSAQGTFYVDCGTDGTLSSDNSTANAMISGGTINKTNTTNYTFKCSYSDSAIRTIRFGGTATDYNTTGFTGRTFAHIAAISFYTSVANEELITSISGNLSTIFPYISANATDGAQPSFFQTFYRAINLQSIPNTLFSGYTTASMGMFYETFYGCKGLQQIPSGLFENITTVATGGPFSGTFYGCTGLQTIPSGLFSNITNVTTESEYGYVFENTFYGCTGLQTIPSDLFAGITTGANDMFYYTFGGCTGLQTIPSDLFSNITTGANNMFSRTFGGCTGLQTIPSGLFASITTGAPNMFSLTFSGCTGLTSIPSDLFAHFTTGASNMFYHTFLNCSNLTGFIPPTLFDGLIKNNAATDTFSNTFNSTGMATSCPSGTEYATQYTSAWGGKVSCNGSPSYSVVSYSCGSGIGTAPSVMTAVSGASFTPSANPCHAPEGYNGFAGWLVDGTSDVRPSETAFTWNYSGDKTLTAQYTGKIIGLTFDGVTTTPATCSFGSTFVPPTPEPRPGFVFTGWKVKEVHSVYSGPKCGIDQLDNTEDGVGTAYTGYTSLTADGDVSNADVYGLSGLGEYAVVFSEGVVYGKASCNNTNGTLNVAGTPNVSVSGQYCWCQVTGFTETSNDYTTGPKCTVSPQGQTWVLVKGKSSKCLTACANSCMKGLYRTPDFRTAMFNAVGQ